jgi:hypothetical protein
MAVSEKQRHELMKAMEGALGPEPAETLMNLLPPVGWADVATKSDLDHLRVAGHADVDLLRAELRGEMGELRSELRAEVAGVRVDLARLRGDVEKALRQQLWAFASLNVAMLTIALAFASAIG